MTVWQAEKPSKNFGNSIRGSIYFSVSVRKVKEPKSQGWVMI